MSRYFGSILLTVLVASGFTTAASAASLKDVILDEIDPGRLNGTVVSYQEELSPEQQTEFTSNLQAGQGYFITPRAVVSWVSDGIQHVKTVMIFLVPLQSGARVTPVAVSCQHSGCSNQCTVTGCTLTTVNGLPACSGASCQGQACGNPNCSKTESTSVGLGSDLLLFGTAD